MIIPARHASSVFGIAFRRAGTTGGVLLLLLGSAPAGSSGTIKASNASHYLNTAPGVHYVGSKVCAGCHAAIFRKFSRTDMGNSMFTPDRLASLGWLTKPADFFNQHNKRRYEIFARGTKVYESEYSVDEQGKDIFRHTEELAYVIGTGENGATPIVRRGNFLFQAPISYYSATKSWDLSPNFETRDLAFNLPITSDCVGCHSGRIAPVGTRGNLYGDPPVLETAIGCESCHGPGELHVIDRQTNAPIPPAADPTIVNPAKLPHRLADDICANCHEGDIRVFRKGKSFVDFRPGTPLNDTVFILKAPIDPRAAQTPLLEHYYSMTLSRCYQGSGEKLSCQTCHDPHMQPSREAAPRYYRSKCLQCHTEKSCSLDLHQRLAQQPADACATCHMPQRPALTVSHSSLTDHRILRTANEPYPRSAFTASLPGSGFIHVNAVPGAADSVPPLALLKGYRQELMRGNLEYRPRYFALLDRLAKSGESDPFVLSALAQKAGSDGDLQRALRFAREAVQPEGGVDSDYLLLETLLARSGQTQASIDALRKGLTLAPYSNALYGDLAVRELAAGNSESASQVIQRGLEIFPEDTALREAQRQMEADARLQQGIALLKQGDSQGAMKEFQAAAELNPQNAPAHDYMGMILGEAGKLNEAFAEFEQAERLDPTLAEPHFHLGLVYLKTGKTGEAIQEYQESLRLNPKTVEARYSLSEICSKLHDVDGAIALLRQVTLAEPDFAEAHYNLGLNLWNRYKNSEALRRQDDLEEGARELTKASELSPRQPQLFFALGQLLADKGDLTPAVENLQKAVDLDSANPEYHYNLGLILRQKGDLDAAAEQFRSALNIAPTLALAHRSLGLVLREKGDLDSAAAELRQSVAGLPEDAQGHHLLGTVLLKQNDLGGAIAELRKAIELDPGLTDARASLAQALQKSGQKEASQAEVAELRKINEQKSNAGQAMVLVQTAAGYSRKGESASAAGLLRQAVSLRPDLTEAQYQLAVALRRTGKLKESEEVLRQILRQHPEDAQARLELGLLLAEQHAATPAAEELREALRLAPSLVEAHIALGKAAKASQDWATAVQEFQAALAWRPDDRAVQSDLALALKANGQAGKTAPEERRP